MSTTTAQPSSCDGKPTAVMPDRESLIRELVISVMVCWKHASCPETTVAEIQRHAVGLKKQVTNLNPTDTELRSAKGQLKEQGFKIDLAPVRFLVAVLTEAAQQQEDGDETHREVAERFANLIRFPEVRPGVVTSNPAYYEGETDEQVGDAGKAFCDCTGADALCVCSRPPKGMTGDCEIPRDPQTGRFIPRS